MILAFLGIDGRSLASHVARLAASSLSRDGSRVTVVRASHPAEANPAFFASIGVPPDIVEVVAAPETCGFELDAAIRDLASRGQGIVLDLPGACLRDPALMGRPDVLAVVPLGPADLRSAGEYRRCFREIGSASGSVSAGKHPTSPRLLGCGWLEAGLASEIAAVVSVGLPRSALLPFSLPPLPRHLYASIGNGAANPTLDALGDRLLAGLRAAFDGGPGGRRDVRTSLAERCWRLAADVEAYEAGLVPTAETLRGCATIDEWSECDGRHRAIAGRFWGDRCRPAGRRAVTSAIVHTDGRTYARTMSSLYRLGAPARNARVG